MAEAGLQKFGEYGLRTSQISQRQGDQLFDYELSFSLFNGQAQFRLGAERLVVNLQNARGERDAQLVLESLIRAVQCIGSNVISKVNLHAASHAIFESEAQCNAFFAAFANPAEGIVDGGRILFVREGDWPSPVRLTAERSIGFKDGIFLLLSTERSGTPDVEAFKQIADIFGKTVQKIGLELKLE